MNISPCFKAMTTSVLLSMLAASASGVSETSIEPERSLYDSSSNRFNLDAHDLTGFDDSKGSVWTSSGSQWNEHTHYSDYKYEETHRDANTVYMVEKNDKYRKEGDTVNIDLYLGQVKYCHEQYGGECISFSDIEAVTKKQRQEGQEDFDHFQDKRCRDGNGFRGSVRSGQFDLFRDVSHQTCRSKCNSVSTCFGYEYFGGRRCEVWKVPIDKSKLVDDLSGVNCFVKDTGDSLVTHNTEDNTAPKPTPPPSPSGESCFTVSTYDSIDSDIATLKNTIGDAETRSHFLGGILRLASHDFMDFDPNNNSPMGPDGCFDKDHDINKGLSQNIWCQTCELTKLYERKYSHVSRADFWIAAAHAVIRQTSVGNALDLKEIFLWGRKDMDSCQGSGERLPTASGCDQTEEVFVRKMGLEWKDAVALMGGHTLGRGSTEHQGSWVGTNQQSQVFDKGYYDQIFNKAWWPRNDEHPAKDWVTTRGSSVDGLMLNTDICLAFDIERVDAEGSPCCTEINNECTGPESRKRTCPMAHLHDSREAVEEMLGKGSHPHPNAPFYNAFTEAWRKATTVGQKDLSPLVESCASLF